MTRSRASYVLHRPAIRSKTARVIRQITRVRATTDPRGSTKVRTAASTTKTTSTTPPANHRTLTMTSTPGQSSGPGRIRRWRLRSPRRRLASRRRRRPPALGAVARRARGVRRASARRSRSRDNTSSRLRAWDRVSAATTRTTGPSRSSSRARCAGESDGDPATSKRTSTRVLEVFACWPPGPPEPEKRHSSSSSGIAHVPVTRSHRMSGTVPARPPRDRQNPTSGPPRG